jgi:hypothetical protein
MPLSRSIAVEHRCRTIPIALMTCRSACATEKYFRRPHATCRTRDLDRSDVFSRPLPLAAPLANPEARLPSARLLPGFRFNSRSWPPSACSKASRTKLAYAPANDPTSVGVDHEGHFVESRSIGNGVSPSSRRYRNPSPAARLQSAQLVLDSLEIGATIARIQPALIMGAMPFCSYRTQMDVEHLGRALGELHASRMFFIEALACAKTSHRPSSARDSTPY